MPPWRRACIVALVTVVDLVGIIGVVGSVDMVSKQGRSQGGAGSNCSPQFFFAPPK